MTNTTPPRRPPPDIAGYRPADDYSGHQHHGQYHNYPPPQDARGQRPPRGRRRRKKKSSGLGTVLFFGLVTILAVVAAGVAFLVMAPPVDFIREQAIAQVKAQTGRDLTIAGRTGLTFFPSLGISMGKVSLSAPPDMAGAPPTAAMDDLTVSVKLLPLLSRQVEVDTLILTNPVFDLRVDGQGRKSWDFAARPVQKRIRYAQANTGQTTGQGEVPPELQDFIDNSTDQQIQPRAVPAPKSAGGSSFDVAALEQLKLGDVRVINGTVRYVDVPKKVNEEIKAINVVVGLSSISNPLTAVGDLVVKGQKVDFDTTLTSVRSVLEKKPAKLVAKLNAKPIGARYDGTFLMADSVVLDGAIAAKSKSVRQLAQWFGSKLPKARGFGPLTVHGRLKAAGSTYSLLNAKLSLDGATGTGDATVNTAGARPYVKANLNLSELNLNNYLSNDGGSAGPSAANPNGTRVKGYAKRKGWSKEKIDLSALGLFDADARLALGKLIYEKITIGQSLLNVGVKDRIMRADLTKMALYKGLGRGTLTLNAASPKPTLAANFAANGVSMRPLLRDAVEIDRLAGAGNINVNLTTAGVSQNQFVRALNGKASVLVKDGAIIGVNIPQLLQSLTQGFGLLKQQSASQKTDFSQLSANFNIVNGIASNDDLLLASPVLNVTGAGKVLLPPRRVDYLVKPKLIGAGAPQGGATDIVGLEIPVRVRGPFENVSYEPDLSGVLKAPGKAIDTVRQLGDQLQKGAGKDLLDGIVGGGQQQQDGQTAPDGKKKIDAKKILDGLFGR